MINPLEFTPRCADLMDKTKALILFERWRIGFSFRDVELEGGKIVAYSSWVSVGTDAKKSVLSNLRGAGETLEQALEEYLHNVSVALDG